MNISSNFSHVWLNSKLDVAAVLHPNSTSVSTHCTPKPKKIRIEEIQKQNITLKRSKVAIYQQKIAFINATL